MKKARFLSFLTVCALVPAAAFACPNEDKHAQMSTPASAIQPAAGDEAPVDLYADSRHTMHEAMMVQPTGDADMDFVNNMLPHHQGAVDMARVELAHGKDLELKKLAQDIIDAQQKEIAFMKAWQKAHQK